MKYILMVFTLSILFVSTEARADIDNLLEDIKIFRYYEEGTDNIHKNPSLSAKKFTKAIDLLKRKPLEYWLISPYKSFTYQQLLITISFWRACAFFRMGDLTDAGPDLHRIQNLNGFKYLRSLGVDVVKTLRAMEKKRP